MNSFLRNVVCILVLMVGTRATHAAESELAVFGGEESGFMCDALDRIKVAYRRADRLDPSLLTDGRVLVLAGKVLPLQESDAERIAAFLNSGGKVLAVGGGAKYMVEEKLFDARGYYPTGTTTFMSKFDGYHRLTFGYPASSPKENWVYGVPNLLRATDGPLMQLGPRAHSVLAAGGPFSLMAYQRFGRGMALLIGPDPQGGDEYLSLDQAKPKLGDQLDTDRLILNAITWLREPQGNLIPNSGFEERIDSGPDRSHWEFYADNGGSSAAIRGDAPEGKVYVVLKRTKAEGSARVSTYLPIAVEPGSSYRFSCRYRSTVDWRAVTRRIKNLDDPYPKAEQYTVKVEASPTWRSYDVELVVPDGIRYLGLILQPAGVGELAVDDVQLLRVGQ